MNKGKLSLILTALIWGVSFSFIDLALDGGWTTFQILGMRGLIGGLFLTLFSYKKKFWLNKRLMIEGMIVGLFLFLGLLFQTYGQMLSTVQNTSFITVLYVVFVPLLLWRQHKMTTSIFIAIVFAVSGTAFLSLDSTFSINIGDLLIIACAFFFAVHIILNERLTRLGDLVSATAIQTYTLSILGFIFAFFEGEALPTSGYGFMLYIGIMASGVAMFTMVYGQAHTHPTVAGLLMTLESFFGALFAILLLSEPLSFKLIIGGALMMSSVVMIEIGPRIIRVFKRIL